MENNKLRTIYESWSSSWGQNSECSHLSGLVHGVKRKLRRLDELPMRVWADWLLVIVNWGSILSIDSIISIKHLRIWRTEG